LVHTIVMTTKMKKDMRFFFYPWKYRPIYEGKVDP